MSELERVKDVLDDLRVVNRTYDSTLVMSVKFMKEVVDLLMNYKDSLENSIDDGK